MGGGQTLIPAQEPKTPALISDLQLWRTHRGEPGRPGSPAAAKRGGAQRRLRGTHSAGHRTGQAMDAGGGCRYRPVGGCFPVGLLW